MKIIVAYILLFFGLFNVAACSGKGMESSPSELRFSLYWKGEKDATPAMLSMLKAAKENAVSTILIEQGEYHFYPDKAFEKYCYIPNHDNGLKRTAFPIINMDNMKLIGEQVKFVFHGLMVPFMIEKSRNIQIEGISIDWELPLHSEVMVVENNEKLKTFDVKIPEKQPYLIRNGELIFLKEGYEHNLETGILFDPELQRVLYNSRTYLPFAYKKKVNVGHKQSVLPFYDEFPLYPVTMGYNMENRIKAEEVKSGVVRISGSNKKLPPVGSILVSKGAGGFSRLAPAIYLNQSSDIELKDMNIFHAGGMGVIAEGCENVRMEHMCVGLEPGSVRMVSTTADATHFINCRGKISFNKCSFSNQLDDATNVHGAYVILEEVLDAKTVGVRVGHFQQLGLFFACPGDRVGIVDQSKSVWFHNEVIVAQVEMVNPGYYKIEFKNDLPGGLRKGMVLENLDAYPEIEITNSQFKNNRARGILLSTPKKVLVEDNYFSNMMSAIFMPVELSYWYESGHCQDVIIRRNHFVDCAYGGGRSLPVIFIHTTLDHNDYVFGKIVIEDNIIEQFDAAILQANGVKDLTFSKNRITSTSTYQPLYPGSPAVEANHIGKLIVEDNHFEGIARKTIMCQNIENRKVNRNEDAGQVLTTKK